MSNVKLKYILDQKLRIEKNIRWILDDAAYAERFLAKPNNRRCPSMYSLIETCYTPEEFGFWTKKLVLRATPRQMTHYGFAIDLLLLIDEDVYDNPIEARKLLWLRANRHPFTKLGKMFGYHRTTLKRKYEMILERLADKVRISFLDKFDKIFI